MTHAGAAHHCTPVQGEEPEDAVWVVLKWDGLAPLALYPGTQQTSGLGLGRLFGGQGPSVLDRAKMLRAITHGALQALGYCHEQVRGLGRAGGYKVRACLPEAQPGARWPAPALRCPPVPSPMCPTPAARGPRRCPCVTAAGRGTRRAGVWVGHAEHV